MRAESKKLITLYGNLALVVRARTTLPNFTRKAYSHSRKTQYPIKKLYFFTLLLTTLNTSRLLAQTDLELVKPIIHIADSLNGGYYGGLSQSYTYDYMNIDTISSSLKYYLGAIVKNSGQDTITNYFLKINALGQSSYAGNFNTTLYSDTLGYLAPGAVDTIRVPVFHLSTDNYNRVIPQNLTLSYQLLHDSTDAVPENDTITLPTIKYYLDLENYVYRLGTINDTVNLINHPQYLSGSFVGISSPVWLSSIGFWGEYVYLAVADTNALQNIYLELRVYEDTTLVATGLPNTSYYPRPFFAYPTPYFDSLIYIGFYPNINILPISLNDTSTLTVGIYFEYDTTATNIPPFGILADTGNYHTFEVETRALVNGSWQTMDFVPLILRGLIWEGIEEYQNSAEVYWFPNPASEQTTLRIRQPNLKNYPATVAVLDITGKQVLSAKVTNNQSIDISALSPGVYMVLTHINGQRFAAKLIKP